MIADWLLTASVLPLTTAAFVGADGLLGGSPKGLDEPLAVIPPLVCLVMVLLAGAGLVLDGAALWRRITRSVATEALN